MPYCYIPVFDGVILFSGDIFLLGRNMKLRVRCLGFWLIVDLILHLSAVLLSFDLRYITCYIRNLYKPFGKQRHELEMGVDDEAR